MPTCLHRLPTTTQVFLLANAPVPPANNPKRSTKTACSRPASNAVLRPLGTTRSPTTGTPRPARPTRTCTPCHLCLPFASSTSTSKCWLVKRSRTTAMSTSLTREEPWVVVVRARSRPGCCGQRKKDNTRHFYMHKITRVEYQDWIVKDDNNSGIVMRLFFLSSEEIMCTCLSHIHTHRICISLPRVYWRVSERVETRMLLGCFPVLRIWHTGHASRSRFRRLWQDEGYARPPRQNLAQSKRDHWPPWQVRRCGSVVLIKNGLACTLYFTC